MLKALTHFEQVPLAAVMKILKQEKQCETDEESPQTIEQNQSGIQPAIITKNEDDRD